MREIVDIQELRELQLQILDTIHNFCEIYGIKYSLSSGTLIGAIRHNGFIPWDDDIDLYMKRDEYEKFKSCFNKGNNRYKFLDISIDKHWPFPYGKVCDTETIVIENADYKCDLGVNIDIFPIDFVPNDIIDWKKKFNKLIKLRNILDTKNIVIQNCRNPLSLIYVLVSKIRYSYHSRYNIIKSIEELADVDSSNTSFLYNYGCGSTQIEARFPSEDMEEYLMHPFEDREYYIMKGYDDYLKRTYGNYMQLPPLDQQITHHSFKAYFKH